MNFLFPRPFSLASWFDRVFYFLSRSFSIEQSLRRADFHHNEIYLLWKRTIETLHLRRGFISLLGD